MKHLKKVLNESVRHYVRIRIKLLHLGIKQLKVSYVMEATRLGLQRSSEADSGFNLVASPDNIPLLWGC